MTTYPTKSQTRNITEATMTDQTLKEILKRINYKTSWIFVSKRLGEGFLVWGEFSASGEAWKTRKWYVSGFSTTSEVIQTILKCILTAEEHEAREVFKYCGKNIFGPHISYKALEVACESLDCREDFIT